MSKKFVKSKIGVWSVDGTRIKSNQIHLINPVEIPLDDIIQIDSSDQNMIALTKQGNAYGKGSNETGQLALGDINERNVWTHIPLPFKVKKVSCKSRHSLFLSCEGNVYSAGLNLSGQLYTQSISTIYSNHQKCDKTGNKQKWFFFCTMRAQQLYSMQETKLVVSKELDLFKTSRNDKFATNIGSGKIQNSSLNMSRTILYAFGNNSCGQLGINKRKSDISTPTVVKFFDDKSPIQDVKTGAFHSIILLQNGDLYGMGLKKCCGQSKEKYFYYPALISIQHMNFQSFVCCSWAFTMVQNSKNELYAFGSTTEQTFIKDGRVIGSEPFRMDYSFPFAKQIKKIIATNFSFFLLTNKNDLYTAGYVNSDEKYSHTIIDKWILCKTNVVNINTGFSNLFLFIPNSFLFYESNMKYTDLIIVF